MNIFETIMLGELTTPFRKGGKMRRIYRPVSVRLSSMYSEIRKRNALKTDPHLRSGQNEPDLPSSRHNAIIEVYPGSKP
jgi:hypothetical protein